MFSPYFYYTAIGISISCYLLSLRLFRLPLLTFTSVNYLLAVLLAMLPGYAASTGSSLSSELQRGFDPTIYFLYLSFGVALTGAALIGQIMGKRYALLGKARPNQKTRIGLVLAFVAVYAAAYFYWVPEVPLRNLVFGTGGFGEAADQRITITHQLGDLESGLPWAFRYWRTGLQYWPAAICFLLAFGRWTGLRIPSVVFYGCLAATAFLLTFTLEKALLVEFMFGLLIIPGLVTGRKEWRRLVLVAGVSALVSMGCIVLFMGADVMEVPVALWQRLNEQTASIYVQIQHVRDQGYLGLHGIKVPFGSWVLGRDYYVDLGREAYAIMFPERASAGMVGSAAGLSLAELYFAFGWFGLPMFVGLVIIQSWVDIVWRNGIQESSDQQFRRVAGAFYVLGMTLFSLTYVSSVLLIISLPFGLSAQCLFIGVLYVWFVDIFSLRIVKLK